jgi:hypothetical protein
MRRVEAAEKINARTRREDTADTYGVRGGGAATWQARWGMKLNETDLLFAVRREPICKRTVVDVAYDMFAKGFTVLLLYHPSLALHHVWDGRRKPPTLGKNA